MTTRRPIACLFLATLGLLAGCGSTMVRGTVVGAPIGRAIVVDARDERLDTQGLAGVEIKVVHPGTETRGGIAPIATAVSDEAGRFELRLPDREKIRGQIVVVTEGEGSLRTATRIYPPRAGQEVLINVRQRTTAGAGGNTE